MKERKKDKMKKVYGSHITEDDASMQRENLYLYEGKTNLQNQ